MLKIYSRVHLFDVSLSRVCNDCVFVVSEVLRVQTPKTHSSLAAQILDFNFL